MNGSNEKPLRVCALYPLDGLERLIIRRKTGGVLAQLTMIDGVMQVMGNLDLSLEAHSAASMSGTPASSDPASEVAKAT